MYARLQQALPDLTEQAQIILSRPQQVELIDKPRVLWLHDLPQDPASQCLKDQSYRTNFNQIVCVSHWQAHQYHLFLGIPYSEMLVIKNAIPVMPAPVLPKPREDGKFRFIYTPTPHRGLAILAAAADALAKERSDWELDVYSSFNLYGWEEQDKQFQELYDRLRSIPNVNYHGTVSNDIVRQAIQRAHCFVYPSIYQETASLASIEALMAGCLCITTSYGALPETCGEWAWMLPFHEDPNVIAQQTYLAMKHAIDHYDDAAKMLEVQSFYYRRFYDWNLRIPTWQALLERVIQEGVPQERLILGTGDRLR